MLGVTLLSAWPDAGWKVAARRAAFLAGSAAAVLGVLLLLGGPGYLTGIRLTTTGRPHGTDAAALVFGDAWSWTAVVLVPAVIAAVVCAARRRWPQALLLAVLALSALLAPADQARIQTTVSLNKHVDFGAWFAAIAAGYLLSILSRRRAVLAVSLAALIPAASLGIAQALPYTDRAGRDRARQGRPAADEPRRALSRGNHRRAPVLPAADHVAAVVKHAGLQP